MAPVTPPASAGAQSILVATSRAADQGPISYGPERAGTLEFAHLTVSIPPTHQTGRIEWPRADRTDASRHFTVARAEPLPDIDALVREARSTAIGSGEETVLFVHGYNTNFAKGIYRHAQIAWDYDLLGPQVHFAWPSAARPLGYIYDRDSALVARDALVTLLRRLHREDALRLSLVGHSMGGFLVMEALRQIALLDGHELLDRLESVSLVSPDIDIDLFRAQAETLAPLPQPFVIVVARNDRLLRLSSRLARGQTRVGSIEDAAVLDDLGVTIVDMTGLGSNGSNHFLPGTSAAAIAHIQALDDVDLSATRKITIGPQGVTLASIPEQEATRSH